MDAKLNTNKWQFEGTPEAYEAYLAPILAQWTDELVEMAALNPAERVLDLACGTGTVARRIAQQLGNAARITGLDVEEAMLQVAQALWDGSHPSIDWRKGDATSLPFPDQVFDAVFCQQGLQFFPDRFAALKEIHRVLAPGGRFALSVWRSIQYNPGYQAIAEALERRISPDIASMERGPFLLDDIVALRALLRQAGFNTIYVRIAIRNARFASAEELLRQETVSWLGGVVGQVSEATRTTLIQDLNAALANYMDDDGLTFPMETYLVFARV